MTYYPLLRRSNYNTAFIQPERYDFNAIACIFSKITAKKIPTSYNAAVCRLDGSKWQIATKEEIDSLSHLGTWERIRRPSGCKGIKTKLVFDFKPSGKSGIWRYKVRLVPKRPIQIPGIDLQEIYSPVSRYSTLRMSFSFAICFTGKGG